VPRRRCVGCGRVAAKHELLRIALAGPQSAPRGAGARPATVIDRDARLPGRGAYVCATPGAREPARACAALAVKRGGIQRTLRARVSLPPEIVESVGR
jgi:predicted RNA-binding protein YlxR (DUF448 family)